MRCPSCSFDNPPGMNFCGQCGQTLGDQKPPPPPAPPQPQPQPHSEPEEAERRQITVMFCDLVDSTKLSTQLDPEELRELMHAYQRAAGEIVSRYDGHVAQYLGDGILIYFGYPRAHEDDSRRAILSALEMISSVNGLRFDFAGWSGRLAVRIGIHTGSVVAGQVGTSARSERLALGMAPNVAARVQSLAEPGQVLLSDDTRRLVTGWFDLESLGQHQLKGVAEPVAVYRATALKASRHGSGAEFAQSPLIGRNRELAQLGERYTLAAQGEPQLVILAATAGVGKTRLLNHFLNHTAASEARRLMAYCYDYYRTSPLHPVAGLVRQLAQIDNRPENYENDVSRLRVLLEPLDWPIEESVPLIAELLGLRLGEELRPLQLSPEKRRAETFGVVLALLTHEAKTFPTVIVFEDLHWADPSTLELIDLLDDAGADSRMLVVLTSRPEFHYEAEWHAASMTKIAVEPLTPEEVEQVVLEVAGQGALPAALVQQIVARTDGIPLFVEELTKSVMESNILVSSDEPGELSPEAMSLSIPTTLKDSLTARLDRVGEAKEIAQLAAVIGRVFSHEMLCAVSGAPESWVDAQLDILVKAELMKLHAKAPDPMFAFKHALIQEAAYGLLLRKARQSHHLRVAEVLLETFPLRAEREPEIVAHHFTEAGHSEPAARHWHRAAVLAMSNSANEEAIRRCRKGLSVVDRLPEGNRRNQLEMLLQRDLGSALVPTRGYTAPEVEQAFARALELSAEVEDIAEHFWILYGLISFHTIRGEKEKPEELGQRLRKLAEKSGDPVLLASMYMSFAGRQFFSGEFRSALDWNEQALAVPPQDDISFRLNAGGDLNVWKHFYRSLILWHLGEPNSAMVSAEQALRTADESGHAYSQALALAFSGAELHQFRREPRRCAIAAARLLELAHQYGFPIWQLQAVLFGSWAEARLGKREPAVDYGEPLDSMSPQDRIRQMLAAYRATGSKLAVPYFLSILADAEMAAERYPEALECVVEALDICATTGDRFWEAEILRQQGELMLLMQEEGEFDEHAEPVFRSALDVARAQQSRALELRVSTSLCLLLQQQGKIAEALNLLASALEPFADDVSTPDLQQARHIYTSLSKA